MIKIKPLTKDELLKGNAVLKEKLEQEIEQERFVRKEIIKLVFPNYTESHNPYSEDDHTEHYTWMRICFEIGKLKQVSKENQMIQILQEQSDEIDRLEVKIAKLCPESKDNPIT